MYKLEQTSTQTIGPQKAASILRFNTFAGQRKMRRQHVEHLVAVQKSGAFVKGHIALARNGSSVPVLMNGQHTCQAITESGISVRCTVDEYTVEEDLDFAKLFATFDVQAARTFRNVVHAAREMFGEKAIANLPERYLGRMGTALWYARANPPSIEPMTRNYVERMNLMVAKQNDVVGLWEAMSTVECDISTARVGVLTAMVLCWRVNREKFVEFWGPVFSAAGLDRGSPQWRMHKYINEASRGGIIQQFADCAVAAAWWNAFITGDDRKMVKPAAMNEIPKIKG